MMNKSIIGATCACLAVVSFNSNAELIGRLEATPGAGDYQAYYDDVAELTWLADANANGLMNWANANAWAAGLDVAGVSGWRLPDTNPVNGTAYDYNIAYDGTTDYGYNISAPGTTYSGSTGSEMANMFYNVLGNTGWYDTSGAATGCYVAPNYCLTNTGPFSNLQSSYYWSATEYAPSTTNAWIFYMNLGGQDGFYKTSNGYAWAVQSGDVSAVPVPAAAWLFGSGLIGLIGLARRKA
jgi:hypothetical protein